MPITAHTALLSAVPVHDIDASLLYILAEHWKPKLIGLLSRQATEDADRKEYFGHPLTAALESGSQDIIRAVLRHCAGDAARAAADRTSVLATTCRRTHANLASVTDLQGVSALEHAVAKGWSDIVQYLFTIYPDSTRLRPSGLRDAIRVGHVTVLKILLQQQAITSDANVIEAGMKSAIDYSQLEVLRVSLDAAIPANGRMRMVWVHVISYAIHLRQTSIAKTLLNRVVDFDLAKPEFKDLIVIASGAGYLDTVQVLLDKAVDVNALGGYEHCDKLFRGTAFQAAVRNTRIEIAALLADAGARFYASDNKHDAEAVNVQSAKVCERIDQVLLDSRASSGAYRAFMTDELIAASWAGDMTKVKSSLAKGADVDLQRECSHRGRTISALGVAVEQCHAELVNLLLCKGANVNITYEGVGGPLLTACQKGTVAVVKLLLDAGAKVNTRPPFHASALLAGVRARRYNKGEDSSLISAVKLLLDKLIRTESPHEIDEALVLASTTRSTDAVRLLLAAGADINGRGNHASP